MLNLNKVKWIVGVPSAAVIFVYPANHATEALYWHGYTKVAGIELRYEKAVAEAEEVIAKAEAEPEYREKNKGEVVAAQAMTWKGTDFKKGVSARCADFVRHVLLLEGITQDDVPVDKGGDNPRRPGSLGPLMADSFYNPDAGTIILDPNYLLPGDIVMFHETYNGGGRVLPGAAGNRKITHVGIYVGDGMMIDRSTSSRPVNYRSINTQFRRGYSTHFHSALRPYAYNK